MSPINRRKYAVYLGHRCDLDGDVLFYFRDLAVGAGDKVFQSSPVQGIRRLRSPVIDQHGNGRLARYIIETENSEYEVQMPVEAARHLGSQLGA
jgi:hypothetical protein